MRICRVEWPRLSEELLYCALPICVVIFKSFPCWVSFREFEYTINISGGVFSSTGAFFINTCSFLFHYRSCWVIFWGWSNRPSMAHVWRLFVAYSSSSQPNSYYCCLYRINILFQWAISDGEYISLSVFMMRLVEIFAPSWRICLPNFFNALV